MDMDSDVSNLNITICYYGYAFLLLRLLHVQNFNYVVFILIQEMGTVSKV